MEAVNKSPEKSADASPQSAFVKVLSKLPSFAKHMEAMHEKSLVPVHDKELQAIYDKWDEEIEQPDGNIYSGNYAICERNIVSKTPFLATGQSGYFTEQIEKNGFGEPLSPNKEDIEDAKFITECFSRRGRKARRDGLVLPSAFTVLPGTCEINYARQSFPAGIYEDVLYCSSNHELPIAPKVGEDETGYWCRVLEGELSKESDLPEEKKAEALARGERLFSHFCGKKNRVWLIPIGGVQNIKTCFGEVGSEDQIAELPTFAEQSFAVTQTHWPAGPGPIDAVASESYMRNLYNDANFTSEYGVALYGPVPREGLRYVEVERTYDILQKKAIASGLRPGDEIDTNALA